MTFQVALAFEDGVTRFIKCKPNETVADASYKARINIPLDCRDGACGTCKAFCESGTYDGGDYIEDALTDEEAEQGFCLPCQMMPESDLVVQIASTSDVAKTAAATYTATITELNRFSDSVIGFTISIDNRDDLVFLPGQYVNIGVPGSDDGTGKQATRSYSFSTGPNEDTLAFLVKITDGGLMSEYLRDRAQVGDTLEFTGPFGSFFLRERKRPSLLLAGGTGLAPLLSILSKVSVDGSDHPIHLIYGVTFDHDLAELDKLEEYSKSLPGFTFDYCVADENSSAPNKGYVTGLFAPQHLNDGDVDIYLCGPPPMVEAVRTHLADQGIVPANFYFEKFNTSATPGGVTAPAPTDAEKAAAEKAAAETGQPVALDSPADPGNYEIGEEHPPVAESDAQFDARMALELGVLELTIGRLTPEQLVEFRILAEASGASVEGDHFTDAEAFTDTTAAFHQFLFRCCTNPVLLDAYNRLEVTRLMYRVLRDAQWIEEHIVDEHLQLVEAYEQGDRARARDLIVAHADHAKATMRRAISDGATAGAR
ncbi:benzoate 1,2-dioxygenase electron transfer component BenC [Rhodococcus yananensis]|uniref:benzoate 1,2-dioxygenase electron transfer component BenC n=1 Tax=Rhodococcus yananensis TaxID=2879464 RepID=UPI001CF8F36C|nr:benzoate 1,2-dioxygenase electron transfer component BenC [Rhodococcus yananensis]